MLFRIVARGRERAAQQRGDVNCPQAVQILIASCAAFAALTALPPRPRLHRERGRLLKLPALAEMII